ncbi:MAG: hypothetical protein NHB32_25095 [Fischerella sp. CENA71]|nr:hypothetical protein [Fischerella sp. CENA71]
MLFVALTPELDLVTAWECILMTSPGDRPYFSSKNLPLTAPRFSSEEILSAIAFSIAGI